MGKFAWALFTSCMLLAAPALAQPAPPLQSVQVLAVSSTGHGSWDYISNGGLSTPSNLHSGPDLWVATYEQGYSVSRQAKFNGLTMNLVGQELVPRTGVAYGFIRYWHIRNSFTSGQFTFNAQSIQTFRNFSTLVNVR